MQLLLEVVAVGGTPHLIATFLKSENLPNLKTLETSNIYHRENVCHLQKPYPSHSKRHILARARAFLARVRAAVRVKTYPALWSSGLAPSTNQMPPLFDHLGAALCLGICQTWCPVTTTTTTTTKPFVLTKKTWTKNHTWITKIPDTSPDTPLYRLAVRWLGQLIRLQCQAILYGIDIKTNSSRGDTAARYS